MNNLLYFLDDVVQESHFDLDMIILISIAMLPWIFLIIRYGIFRRLRVRFLLSDNFEDKQNIQELPYVMLKKGSDIPLPVVNIEGYDFLGWYLDEDFTKPYEPIQMPNENLKLYGKLIKK